MPKKALITGIAGQDGSYLSNFLLSKGYEVHGTFRRNSSQEFYRLKELKIFDELNLHEVELTEKYQIEGLLKKHKYDEIYNLAAQSFVATSFNSPLYTFDVNTISLLNILECIKNFSSSTKLYQASTSEMFGKVQTTPQNESTPFYPRSPYGVSKLASHWMLVNYRESYDLFLTSGILFNHESPFRGLEFITKKITNSVARIKKGEMEYVSVGNLNASRDWGFAGDFVKAMYFMLQSDMPDDYVIGTGETHSIREMIELAFSYIDVEIVWEGKDLNEIGVDKKDGKALVKVSQDFFRPAEVDLLLSDASKAKKALGWAPETSFKDLIKMMVEYDLSK